jgi:hypothetical protein
MFETVIRALGRVHILGRGRSGSWRLITGRANGLRQFEAAEHPVILLARRFIRICSTGESTMNASLAEGSRDGARARGVRVNCPRGFANHGQRLAVPPSHPSANTQRTSSQAYDLGRRVRSEPDRRLWSAETPARLSFPPARTQIVSPETGREVAESETS